MLTLDAPQAVLHLSLLTGSSALPSARYSVLAYLPREYHHLALIDIWLSFLLLRPGLVYYCFILHALRPFFEALYLSCDPDIIYY